MSKIMLVILLFLTPKLTYSETITISFIKSLTLLEAKLLVLQTTMQSSETKIIDLEIDLKVALELTRGSEKIIERQASSLKNLSKSLEESERLTQEIEKGQEIIIMGFEQQINQWQMLFFGLAVGSIVGAGGYLAGGTVGGLCGVGVGIVSGIVIALIF